MVEVVTLPEKKALSKKDTFEKILRSQLPAIQNIIPKYVTPERLIKTAVAAISRNPKLLQCTPASIARSFVTCAELGLDFSHELGHAYLVPFERRKGSGVYDAVLIIGYKGWVWLVKRDGRVKKVITDEVFQKEIETGRFKFQPGESKPIHHDKLLVGDRGPVVGYYVLFVLANGEQQAEYMTVEEIEKVRQRSKAKDSGPWVTDYKQMARKTVLRRGIQYIEKSIELAKAERYENEQFGYVESINTELESGENKGGVAALKEKLEEPRQVGVEQAEDAVAEPEGEPEPEASEQGEEPGQKEPDGKQPQQSQELLSSILDKISRFRRKGNLTGWWEGKEAEYKPREDYETIRQAVVSKLVELGG